LDTLVKSAALVFCEELNGAGGSTLIYTDYLSSSPKAIQLIFLIRVHRARSRHAWQTGASEAGGPVFIRLPNLSS
jgi:hypothetical protein